MTKTENKASKDLFFFCSLNRKNKPSAMQGKGKSVDLSKNSCVRIKVGLQTTKKAQEVLKWTLTV